MVASFAFSFIHLSHFLLVLFNVDIMHSVRMTSNMEPIPML